MLSTLDVLLFVGPLLLVFGVLTNADKIVAWWENKHPELVSENHKLSEADPMQPNPCSCKCQRNNN